MLILIAGPYRSGTNDDPALIAQNLRRLEEAALPLFRAGHVPVIGEWIALPLMKVAGSLKHGDKIYNEISYPVAHRLLQKCDAILRLPGESNGADQDVAVGKTLGLRIFYSVREVLEHDQQIV